MTIWKLSSLVVAAAVLSACASDKNNTPDRTLVAISYEDQVTCKSVVRTGTRLGSRQCMSNKAWHAQAANAKEALEIIQNRSTHTQTMQGN